MQHIFKSARPHIAFFGCTNSGKSLLVNAITNQQMSVVSDIKGTTTDPVSKSMEILPLGPVVIIDTAGINDESELGKLRIEKTKQILDKTDIAVLVVDATVGETDFDRKFVEEFKRRKLPYLIVYNKTDKSLHYLSLFQPDVIYVSALTKEGIYILKEKIGNVIQKDKKEKSIIKDKLNVGDTIVMVIPIDESAPKGRIILPQQTILREILDAQAIAVCCQPGELPQVLKAVTPKFVITDSQVFNKVKDSVPETIILTSFSILMANYKGELDLLLAGANKLSELKNGDKILIAESCTHHRQCNDIGTIKLTNWIKNFTGKELTFEFTQGNEFPQDLSDYALIVHCGGCMSNEKEIRSRFNRAVEQNIPIVNYGMAIAHMNGILKRSMEIFELSSNE